MHDILLTPIRLSELEMLIQNSVRKVLNEGNYPSLPPSSESNDQPLTVQEAATFTNLAVPTLYSLVSRKEIPFFKRSGSKRLYFLKSELRKWLLEERQKTVSEIMEDAMKSVRTRNNKGR
ncbi:hypothetical protein AHMF7605_21905 [Adhaeribacter arboris]|uniref:Helix-turn-helix domain-containing protein n=1 Tax=Adhaeribacter arboris TaxID=2072846 RepID=A0A2T2YKC5_9BACT|nr:helix-turn-helix domain-containing protein [Adhaeribacter arboris]PSR55966.1 hypothetical protein AHMF7605_21905 [Adhaeribacter arboris]